MCHLHEKKNQKHRVCEGPDARLGVVVEKGAAGFYEVEM